MWESVMASKYIIYKSRFLHERNFPPNPTTYSMLMSGATPAFLLGQLCEEGPEVVCGYLL